MIRPKNGKFQNCSKSAQKNSKSKPKIFKNDYQITFRNNPQKIDLFVNPEKSTQIDQEFQKIDSTF